MLRSLLYTLLFITLTLSSNAQTCMDGQCPTDIIINQLNAHEFNFEIANSCPDAMVAWSWDGVASQTAMAQSISHNFTTPGAHTVAAVVNDPDCNGGEITLAITVLVQEEICNPQPVVTQLSCGSYLFSASVPVDSTMMYWTFSNSNAAIVGSYTYYGFNSPGVYTATMHFNGVTCSDVVQTVAVEVPNCAATTCGSDIVLVESGQACGTYTFQMPGINPAGNYTWQFGDGGQSGGNSTATHTFTQPGTYVVTATAYSAACPNGQAHTYTIVVPDCGNSSDNCPQSINFSQTDCGLLNFSPNIDVQDGETVAWIIGNNISQGREENYFLPEGGNTNVCMYYQSSNCPGIQVCSLQYIAPCAYDNVLQIDTLQINGDVLVLSASGVDFPETVVWSVNGVQYNVGSTTTFVFGNSPILICASYEGADVSAPVQICFYVSSPNATPCPTGISYSNTNQCNEFVFWLENVAANDAVYWSFGNNTAVTGDSEMPYTFTAPGTYQIYAAGFSSLCGSQYGLTVTVEVPNCMVNPACSDSIYVVATTTCGLFGFEIGGFHQGESAIWTFDNETITGGHYIEHQFTTPGAHTITVFITNNDCPEGSFDARTITVPNCSENNCSIDFTYVDYGCQGVVFTATTTPITDLIDWYINDVYYASGQTVNITGPHGLQNVCARLSPNICPDGISACGQVYFQQCNPSCTLAYIVGTSNVILGSTTAAAYRAVDSQGDTLQLGVLNFSENNYYATDSICVPDGCYSIIFDSSLPYAMGDGLNITIYNPAGDVLADMSGIEPIDNYAFTMNFGMNSNCSAEPETCQASFEIVSVQQGTYNFVNTSSYAGSVQFNWNLGNGITTSSQDTYMTYVQASQETVCLSLVTDTGCASDTCITFEALPVILDPCQGLTPVLIQLGSDLGSITENLSLHILVNTSNGLLYENTFTLTPGQIEDINICAPTGCYEVLLEGTNWANLSDALVVNMFVNGLSVNQIGLTETLESMVGVLPVLSDCTISVNENTETSLEIYPNPVNTELNIKWVSAQNGANYRLLDQSGRIVLSGRMNGSRHTLDVSAVSSGLYILETSNGINLQQIRVAIEH